MNIKAFLNPDFPEAIRSFFKDDLNIEIKAIDDNPTELENLIPENIKDNDNFNAVNEAYMIGMIDDSIFNSEIESLHPDEIKSNYDGIVVFGLKLDKRENNLLPTRTQIADIARAFNREYPYTPVVVIFRYADNENEYFAFANTERLAYKQNWREGEKAGKVSVLRDVNINDIHSGHKRILLDLQIKTTGKNPIDSFEKLYKHWQNVFSVSILNKKFYNDLSNWYFWAVKNVKFPSEPTIEQFVAKEGKADDKKLKEAITEHNSKNVIRLLTRLLFTWFIKEKKLIPEELFSLESLQDEILTEINPENKGLFSQGDYKSIYYKAILQNLFFASLNCPIKADKIDTRERGFRGDSYGQHRGVDYLMRYKKYFKNPDSFLKLINSKVPFLNGGLFECLDDKHSNLYIDGFSDQMTKGEKLIVPDFLFFGTDENVDLSADYGTKNKAVKNAAVKGLINILKSYKFTITENTPIEEDVALDPELLGKVFENLLASYNPETKTTARKQTGSFYTPREIVNYMVDESLIAYLKNHIVEAGILASSIVKDGNPVSSIAKDGNPASSIAKDGNPASSIVKDSNPASSIAKDGNPASSIVKDSNLASSIVKDSNPVSSIVKDGIHDSSIVKDSIHDSSNPFLDPSQEINIHEGNLPHWVQENVAYFVTFRLADSIPKDKLDELKRDRERWKKDYQGKDRKDFTLNDWKKYNRLFNKRVEEWMNSGYGKCLLKNKENAKIVADALNHFDGERYQLDEWVIMPNHVHVLVRPFEGYKLSDITHSWKSFTATQINQREGLTGKLWMRESYDHIVRNKEALSAIRNYINKNPEKAGIKVHYQSYQNVSAGIPVSGNVSAGIPASGKASETQAQSKDALETQAQSKDASETQTQSKDALETMLRKLISYSDENPFAENKVLNREIISAIDRCKILDPACGSGAFPMGALHKMVHMLQKLDPENKVWKEVQKQKVQQETSDAFEIEDKHEREQKLIEINEAFDQNLNDPDYARKLYLIENSIYGVDIQPIATQISKLRFFISLVVDQKVSDTENFGIRPLPNLETRFVTANTLIGIEKPDSQLSMFETDKVKELEKELKKVRHKLFSVRTKETKLKYRDIDKELRNKIAEELKQIGWASDSAEKLAAWDPYDQNASSPFFDPEWMFDIKNGFDVVIGNPPYIKEYTDKNVFEGLRDSEYYQGKMDLWYIFACSGIDFLKKHGNLVFIATNNWITNEGASILRNKVLEETKINQFLDFRDFMIFESASIQTMVFVLEKYKSEKYKIDYRKINSEKSNKSDVIDLINKVAKHTYEFIDFEPNRFLNKRINFSNSNIDLVLDKINNLSNFQFDKKKEIAQGIVAPQDFLNKKGEDILNGRISKGAGVFNLTENEKSNLYLNENELELIKPFYTSNELNRFYWSNKNNLWVIYTTSNFKDPNSMNNYPNLKNHLDQFKNIITSDNKPYGLHRARNENFFIGEKIVSQRKCPDKPVFCYTDSDCYVSQTYFVIKTKRLNQKYLTGLLNSIIVEFWLRNKGKMQGKAFQVDKGPLLEIPIYKPDKSIQNEIAKIVDYIIYDLKTNNKKESKVFESIIDAIVFQLYFPDHMKERKIDILKFVEQDLEEVVGNREFEELEEDKKHEIIEELEMRWSNPESEIQKRISSFKVKSPDLLGVILGDG